MAQQRKTWLIALLLLGLGAVVIKKKEDEAGGSSPLPPPPGPNKSGTGGATNPTSGGTYAVRAGGPGSVNLQDPYRNSVR